jgi:CheY-like chemotaxis protein
MRQVLVNLLGNAIKYTPRGSVELEVHFKPPSRLEFVVRDTGMGIAPEFHEAVFQPFSRGEAAIRRKPGGTGLGLAISRRIAEALGGELLLMNSRAGEGSTFLFAIDCRVVNREDEPAAAADGPADQRELNGLKLLLVEDSIDSRDLAQLLLQRQGADVDVAECAMTGIQMALARKYDAVLMDIQMPGMSGWEAVSFLRSRGYDRPIAALTAHALTTERERAVRLGFNAYLTKPIDLKELVQTVRRLTTAEDGKNYH